MRNQLSILLLSGLALLSGCAMEDRLFENESQGIDGKEITIQGIREGLDSDEGPATRTVRDESNGDVLWVPGDAISLFYGSGSNGGSKFTSVLEEGTAAVTNFTGTITAITAGADVSVDDTYFWGVYPYSDDVSCDGTIVTMTVPTAQAAVPGTFATGLFPSIGHSQGLTMGFYNVCGGWRFSVTKEGVRKVTLKSNGGEQITGKVKVGLNDAGVPEIREIIDGSDEVVLECPAGEYLEVGKYYYMVLLPTVFESGFTMTFETYTEEGVYNRTKKTTVARSNFPGITNLDDYLTTPYAPKTGNIPVEDANFKAYLVENFDSNGDGEISYAEAAEITEIDVCTDDIESVQGIEFMLALRRLSCRSNSGAVWSPDTGTTSYGRLSSLDVSNNPALTSVQCGWNQLTTLDVSNSPTLTYLDCTSNQLTTLDVSDNPALTNLRCNFNHLTTLDLSNNPSLESLSCNNNQLTTLDVSKNPVLTDLRCNFNHLTTLDLSNNPSLEGLSCHNNQLTTLDVSNNPALTWLESDNNHLTTLDVSKNTALTYLDCSPMDVNGSNVLGTLFIFQGQEIPNVTTSRNTEYIPAETQIVVKPDGGSNEGTGDEEVDP